MERHRPRIGRAGSPGLRQASLQTSDREARFARTLARESHGAAVPDKLRSYGRNQIHTFCSDKRDSVAAALLSFAAQREDNHRFHTAVDRICSKEARPFGQIGTRLEFTSSSLQMRQSAGNRTLTSASLSSLEPGAQTFTNASLFA